MEPPQRFEFGVIRDQLQELLRAVENLLARELPRRLPENPDAAIFFLASFRFARHTFDSVRYLCVNRVTEPGEALPRPEYALTVPPLNRFLLDTAMVSVFLLESLEDRWEWFVKAGWREMRLESDRLASDFGSLPRWRDYLDSVYRPLLEQGAARWRITAEEAAAPETIRRWPNPGQLPRYEIAQGEESPASRRFLARLEAVLYIDTSQQAHLTHIGVLKRAGFLLGEIAEADVEARREMFHGYASDQVFAAITLMLAICSIFDGRFNFEIEGRLRYLWATVTGFWDPANVLLEARYERPLF